MSTRCARASPICSRRSRSPSRISCWRTRRRCCATSTAASTGTGAPRARRWAPRRWPARPSRCSRNVGGRTRLRRALRELDRRGRQPRPRRRVPVRRRDDRRAAVAAGRRDRAVDAPGNSAGSSSTMASPPAARSCRRRRTRTSPSSTRGTRGAADRRPAAILTVLKALPFAYNRDLAEDKRAAFDAVDALAMVLPALAGMVRRCSVDVGRSAGAGDAGFTLATEVADWLSRRGVPFAEAHEITGALVRFARRWAVELRGAGAGGDCAAIDPRLDADVLAVPDAGRRRRARRQRRTARSGARRASREADGARLSRLGSPHVRAGSDRGDGARR